jgi:hypothetical protein
MPCTRKARAWRPSRRRDDPQGREYRPAAGRPDLRQRRGADPDLLDAGYNVHLHLVDLPGEKAVERATARFAQTGRLVPLDYIRSIGDAPKTFTRLVDEYKGKLGGHVHVTNDVPIGEAPRLVEASSDELAARLGYDRGESAGEGPRAAEGGSAGEQRGSAQEAFPD